MGVFVEALLIRRLLQVFGFSVKMELYGDSSAAQGIANRSGVGRVKHLELKTVRLQQFTMGRRGDESVVDSVIRTSRSGADIGTEAHSEARLRELMNIVGLRRLAADQRVKEGEQDVLAKDIKGAKDI